MKKIIRYCFLVVAMFLFIRATCGRPKLSTKPMTGIEIMDYVFFHNVSITFDGDHYFTLNGGNENYCVINEYDENLDFIETYDVGLDGRAIFYNPKDKNLYVKIYGTDLWTIDFDNGTAGVRFSDIFEEDNSSPAFSPDGKYIYELINGYVRVIDFKTGEELEHFILEHYYDEHGYGLSIAASKHYLFVWEYEDRVLVYDLDGEYVTKIKLPRAGYGFSLSYCNDMLWIAEDADASTDGGDGYWYGFEL
jgi:DNA-binding beta-propeller fold protein YncE